MDSADREAIARATRHLEYHGLYAEADAVRDAIERLERENDELRAARVAYASEFAPAADGAPDVGSIHANIRAMKSAATCGCGDQCTPHDPATCGVCASVMRDTIAAQAQRIAELEREVERLTRERDAARQRLHDIADTMDDECDADELREAADGVDQMSRADRAAYWSRVNYMRSKEQSTDAQDGAAPSERAGDADR